MKVERGEVDEKETRKKRLPSVNKFTSFISIAQPSEPTHASHSDQFVCIKCAAKAEHFSLIRIAMVQ